MIIICGHLWNIRIRQNFFPLTCGCAVQTGIFVRQPFLSAALKGIFSACIQIIKENTAGRTAAHSRLEENKGGAYMDKVQRLSLIHI